MKDLLDKIFNMYTLISAIIGLVIGVLTSYYGFVEKIDVMEYKIESLIDEDRNLHDILHLHYTKMLKLD